MTMPRSLDTIRLGAGDHDNADGDLNLLELTAYFAGEPHSFGSDPECVSPVLAGFGRELNDYLDDEKRQLLKPFAARMIGTAGDGLDEARSFHALDWLIRTFTPAWLELASEAPGATELATHASELRALRPIVDMAAAEEVGPVVRAACQAAEKIGKASLSLAPTAREGLNSAGGRAATLAAWHAAEGDAARDATQNVSGAAAVLDAAVAAAAVRAFAGWNAAMAAATPSTPRDALSAGAALVATVDQIQDSAIALLDRMIDPA